MTAALYPPQYTNWIGAESFNRDQNLVCDYIVTSRVTGVTMVAEETHYRAYGTPTWTLHYVSDTTTPNHVFNPGFFTAGLWERRTRVEGSDGNWSDWSQVAQMNAVQGPALPTITAPAQGSTVGAKATLTWTVTAQTAYQVRTYQQVNGVYVYYYDSGEITSDTARSHVVPFPTNGVSRGVFLRVKLNGVWGDDRLVSVNVSWIAPMTPTVVATATDPGARGMLHAISVAPTFPTVSGGAPATTTYEVWVRKTDLTEGPIRVAAAVPVATVPFVWYLPGDGSWQVQVVALAADGVRTAASAWTSVSAANTIKGLVILDPDNPTTGVVALRLNADVATETVTQDAALMQYAGRSRPVAEYGPGGGREVEVPLVTIRSATDRAALVALADLRKPVLYRDKNRRCYGLLDLGRFTDTFYGWDVAFKITELDQAATKGYGVK